MLVSVWDGYPLWPRLCRPACCYWCHPFCCSSGLFKSMETNKNSIHLLSVASSTINCSFSFSVGLMTLTPRRGMGLRALTEVSNWYCLLALFTTVLDNDCYTTVDGRICSKRKAALSKGRKKKWTIVTTDAQILYVWRGQATPEHREEENTHSQTQKHMTVCSQKARRQSCVTAPKTSFICCCIKNVWLWFSYNVCHITKWQVFQLSNNDLFANSILLKKRQQADVKWIKHWMGGSWQFHFILSLSPSESL